VSPSGEVKRISSESASREKVRFALLVSIIGSSCVPLKSGTDPAPDGAADTNGRATTSTTHTSDVATGTSGGAGGWGGAGGMDSRDARDDDMPCYRGGAAGRGTDAEGGSGGVVQLAGGYAHACALLQSGGVRCWGWGQYGVLGYGNENDVGDDETPASVGDVDIGGKATQIAAGDHHTCALLEEGRLRCWGWGFEGALGYGHNRNIGDDEAPASAGDVDVGGKVIQVTAGSSHTCTLLETGAVRCWGSPDFGKLGYANTKRIGDDETPASAGDVNVGGKVVEIAAGGDSTCARLESGAVRCWGFNNFGQLGYGHTMDIGDDESPAWAGNVDVGAPVTQITIAAQSVCVVVSGGRVRCWGVGAQGQLGYANTKTIGDDEAPSMAGDVDVGCQVLQVNCLHDHCCAVLEGGKLRCWGRGTYGQLGYANTHTIGDDETPASAGDVRVGGPAVQAQVGEESSCALLEGGRVRCWGYGSATVAYGHPLAGPIGDDEYPDSAGDVPVF
jgi:alpha-tubulin suppressor-like RCC1 family protein